jgi:hypothetical protein
MPAYLDFATHSTEQSKLAYYTQSFVVHPTYLNSVSLPVKLEWKNIRFTAAELSSIIEQPGVYAFVLSHNVPDLPQHGYVLYIGHTKGKKHPKTLKMRANEYLKQEKARPKRPHVWEFLNKWETCLSFHFAAVDPTKADLFNIEKKLNDAMMPPYSRRDFTASIRRRKQIWETS